MKKLMQVDLAAVATPVKSPAKVVKKKKEEERPDIGGKGLKSLPLKIKKPPTEKQLAARERMKAARILKLEEAREAKEKLSKEIQDKKDEVLRKKAELVEKRKQKREERKAIVTPTVTSGPVEAAEAPEVKPTISQVLQDIQPSVEPVTPLDFKKTPEPVTVAKTPLPGTPMKRARYFNYPYGKNIPIPPRFR